MMVPNHMIIKKIPVGDTDPAGPDLPQSTRLLLISLSEAV